MPTTKSANQGKQNDESKRGQQSMNDNRQKGSMSMNKTNKSDTNSSKSHK